jgi:hypothetical protein
VSSNTDSLVTITQFWVDKFKANAVTLGIPDLPGTTGPAGSDPSIFYSDQTLIPVTPTVCVESGPKLRDLRNTGFASTNTFTVYVMVYHGKLQDEQVNKKECDQFAEAIEALMHTDKQAGGLMYNGWVERIDPGIARRNKSLFRVSRLTWIGNSKTIY